MHKTSWVFPAMTVLLLINVLLGNQLILGLILFGFWIIRILFLNDKSIFRPLIFISCIFILNVCLHQLRNESVFEKDTEVFVVSPEMSSIEVDGDYLSFQGWLRTDHKKNKKEKIVVRHYIETKEKKNEWMNLMAPGHLMIKGKLKQPSINTNFHQFNYREYLKRNKIYWQLHAEEINWLEAKNLEEPFFYKIGCLRFRMIQHIDQTFDKKIAGYLKILLIADGRGLNEEVKGSYRALGLIHLFSISGFHISYFAIALERLFLRLGITHERTRLLLITILPLYGLVAGLSISVFRAICQRVFSLWGTILNKELGSLDAWSMAMLASLMINPYHLFELSFQLSYSMSGLFILLGQQEWISELNFVKQTILFSFLSFLVSIPLLSYHFYEISWATFIANLLFVPFFTVVLFPGLILLFLVSFVLGNTSFFLYINKIIAFILIKMDFLLITLTKRFDFSFVIGRLPQILLIILTLCILNILKKIEQKQRPLMSTVLLVITLINWYQLSPEGYVLMLDVGQGDSILIKDSKTRNITLIDTGGANTWYEKEKWQERKKSFTLGENIIAPSLKSLGISKIDRLYITHAHEDHMGEIENIAKELKVSEIAATRETFEDQKMIEKLKKVKESHLYVVEPMRKLNIPTEETFALHPMKRYQSKNDQSLVLYVKIGRDYWLFTGDMEEIAEKQVVRNYPFLPVDYLKVAHHGSNTSSTNEFVNHIKPSTALISVGQDNRYGHPDIEVLELFKDKHMNVYSTAEDGAIKISYFKIPGVDKWITVNERVK